MKDVRMIDCIVFHNKEILFALDNGMLTRIYTWIVISKGESMLVTLIKYWLETQSFDPHYKYLFCTFKGPQVQWFKLMEVS